MSPAGSGDELASVLLAGARLLLRSSGNVKAFFIVGYAGPSIVVRTHCRYRSAALEPLTASCDCALVVNLGSTTVEEANAMYAGGARKPMYGFAGVEMLVPAASRLWRKS
jgi:hypothetical protein